MLKTINASLFSDFFCRSARSGIFISPITNHNTAEGVITIFFTCGNSW
jgi:hypothetical protein